jgi:hypothetical protein
MPADHDVAVRDELVRLLHSQTSLGLTYVRHAQIKGNQYLYGDWARRICAHVIQLRGKLDLTRDEADVIDPRMDELVLAIGAMRPARRSDDS